MSSWPHPYCPHQAFAKDFQTRIAAIPYTFLPDPTIDAFTNVNVKCANLDKRNIPTLAYEGFSNGAPWTIPDTNFARDYYKEVKDLDAIKLDNNLVRQTQEQLSRRNAYVLASQATVQYNKFDHERKQTLDNARRRANSVLRLHFQQKKDDKIQANAQNGEWLKKLYRKLEEVAKHIIEGDGQTSEEKEKMFLLSKSSLTAGYLSKIKVRNPQTALEILEELRILLMKKKLKFEDQRQQQEKNKSVSMSYTTDTSQNTSQGSMLSEATSVNESNVDGQSQIVSRYCDFEELGKKWRLADVEQVKQMLRFMFTRKFVSDAEVGAIKKKRQAQRINKSLEQLNPELTKKLKEQSKAKRDEREKQKKRAKSVKAPPPPPADPKKTLKQIELNKQELAIKQKLVRGGQFDAVGQKFSRNRNYSNLFIKKEREIKVEFRMVKDPIQKATPKPSDNSKLQSTLNL